MRHQLRLRFFGFWKLLHQHLRHFLVQLLAAALEQGLMV